MPSAPESSLIRRSLTVREMDTPPGFDLTKRALLRWFALSTGLISQNEKRPTALYTLDGVFQLISKEQSPPTTLDLQAYIKKKHKAKVSEKLLRYHLGKLISLGLLARKQNRYHLNPSPRGARDSFSQSFSHWIKQPALESLDTTEKVLAKLQGKYT